MPRLRVPGRVLPAVTVAAAAALLVPAAQPAAAAPTATPAVEVVTTEVAAPFNLEVAGDTVYVADGGRNTLFRLRGDNLTAIRRGPAVEGGEVAGVARNRNGLFLAYTQAVISFQTGNSAGALKITGPAGYRATADLDRYERRANPDGAITYGVENPSACAGEAIERVTGQPATYTGLVDSHPYSVAAYGQSSWLVADAGGNDLLKVSARGSVSRVAVLPRQPLTFTAQTAAALGLPDCVVGVTYEFESVPTDVEVGPGGALYVSVLAGGPEDPSIGARSTVYRVDPRTGRATQVADGLAGATNLAVARDGTVYVAELFGGRIAVIRDGKPETYAELPNALAVETGPGGTLWASTLAPFGQPGATGSVVRIG